MVATKNLLATAALAAISSAANVMVQVGQSGLAYSPSSITANVGDTVTFTFDGTHSVVQSTFNAPCSPLANGFAVPAQSSSGAMFTINITDTNPRWFYCSVSSHCQDGMVGVINPPNGETQADFAKAASSANGGNQPGGISGGQLVVGSVTSGSLSGVPQTSSAASTATSSGTQSSTSTSASAASTSSKGAAAAVAGNLGGAMALVAGALAVVV